MSEYRTLLSDWPAWARLALVLALLPFFVLAIVFGYTFLIWCLGGPIIVFEFWRNRDTGELNRRERPFLFWSSITVFSLMTLRGVFELYQKLTELPL